MIVAWSTRADIIIVSVPFILKGVENFGSETQGVGLEKNFKRGGALTGGVPLLKGGTGKSKVDLS